MSNLLLKFLPKWFTVGVAVFFLATPQVVAAQVTNGADAVPPTISPLMAYSSPMPLLLQSAVLACPSTAASMRGSGRSMRCLCSRSAASSGSVWGSGTYTDDSRICRAAVHAGQISSNGGAVRFRVTSGLKSYPASTRNGVSSGKWGSWSGSIRFNGGGSEIGSGGSILKTFCPATAAGYRGSGKTISCGCAGSETRAGLVWGSGPYTDDSKICRAAMHAGVIGISGGNVILRMVGPRSSYGRSSANGVNASNYGAWRGSFIFIP